MDTSNNFSLIVEQVFNFKFKYFIEIIYACKQLWCGFVNNDLFNDIHVHFRHWNIWDNEFEVVIFNILKFSSKFK